MSVLHTTRWTGSGEGSWEELVAAWIRHARERDQGEEVREHGVDGFPAQEDGQRDERLLGDESASDKEASEDEAGAQQERDHGLVSSDEEEQAKGGED